MLAATQLPHSCSLLSTSWLSYVCSLGASAAVAFSQQWLVLQGQSRTFWDSCPTSSRPFFTSSRPFFFCLLSYTSCNTEWLWLVQNLLTLQIADKQMEVYFVWLLSLGFYGGQNNLFAVAVINGGSSYHMWGISHISQELNRNSDLASCSHLLPVHKSSATLPQGQSGISRLLSG